MEAISYYSILGSSELAKERGSYATYKGSLWDQGILPIDSIKIVAENRGDYMICVFLLLSKLHSLIKCKILTMKQTHTGYH